MSCSKALLTVSFHGWFLGCPETFLSQTMFPALNHSVSFLIFHVNVQHIHSLDSLSLPALAARSGSQAASVLQAALFDRLWSLNILGPLDLPLDAAADTLELAQLSEVFRESIENGDNGFDFEAAIRDFLLSFSDAIEVVDVEGALRPLLPDGFEALDLVKAWGQDVDVGIHQGAELLDAFELVAELKIIGQFM